MAQNGRGDAQNADLGDAAQDLWQTLVDYARHNNVDHIVIGARASSALRRYLGSVSSQVVAEAPCSVTVVRTPKDRREANG